MNPSPFAAVALLLWAGLCAADQRALGGRQIHQPIVAAVGAGLILGAPDRALLVGIWMQLIWSAPLPIGGAILPDTGSVAVAASVLASFLPGGEGLLAAILLGLLLARLSLPWEVRLRSGNEAWEERILTSTGRFAPGIARGIAGPFLRGVAFATAAGLVGSLIGRRGGLSPGGPVCGAIEIGLLGGAACLGYAALLLRMRTEAGRDAPAWIAGGILLGAACRLLLAEGTR